MSATPGALWLSDGSQYTGNLLGVEQTVAGEVVFNTAMTGYQEILSDPSYCGQIVVFTYPLIGNYGTWEEWNESRQPWVEGMVARYAEPLPSHSEAVAGLDRYLTANGKTALIGVDTRALTRRLRAEGTLLGVIAALETPRDQIEAAMAAVNLKESVYRVSTAERYTVPPRGAGNIKARVALVDFGAKTSIVEALTERGAEVTVLPATVTQAELDALAPDGVVLSNGPGNPEDVPEVLPLVRHAIGHYPVLGICLGHQLVALAEGAKTYRLKFGHHGANHPLVDEKTGKVIVTSQNHGYSVDPEAILDRYKVRMRNLHDQTVEALEHTGRPVLTVQHHPEAGPGPKDSLYIFDEFMDLVGRKAAASEGAKGHA